MSRDRCQLCRATSQLNRPPSTAAQRRQLLKIKIQALFEIPASVLADLIGIGRTPRHAGPPTTGAATPAKAPSSLSPGPALPITTRAVAGQASARSGSAHIRCR
jgi:hypothetical protein